MVRSLRVIVVSASFLSLLLCGATVALWVRSYYKIEVVKRYRSQVISVAPDVQAEGKPEVTKRYGIEVYAKGPRRTAVARTLLVGFWACNDRGRIILTRSEATYRVTPNTKGPLIKWEYKSAQHRVVFGVTRTGHEEPDGTYDRQTDVSGPIWPVALAFGVGAFPFLRRVFRRRPIVPGLCRVCGYDLRASPSRCPQCGTPLMTYAELRRRKGSPVA